MAPVEIVFAILPIGIATVCDAEIVRRRGHNEIDCRTRDFGHALETVAVAQIE